MHADRIFEVCSTFVESINAVCICFYRPPDNSRNVFESFLSQLYEFLNYLYTNFKNANVILTGDFNIDFLSNCVELNEIQNLFDSFGLRITNRQATRPGRNESNGTCLDNIATNIHDEKCSTSLVQTVVSDHNALICNV